MATLGLVAQKSIPACPIKSVVAKSPGHSLNRDRQAEMGSCQGSSLAAISNSSAFMISFRSVQKEKYPLWTPLKRKESLDKRERISAGLFEVVTKLGSEDGRKTRSVSLTIRGLGILLSVGALYQAR
jgi:hypothetical protein